jgi:hypothetical protein
MPELISGSEENIKGPKSANVVYAWCRRTFVLLIIIFVGTVNFINKYIFEGVGTIVGTETTKQNKQTKEKQTNKQIKKQTKTDKNNSNAIITKGMFAWYVFAYSIWAYLYFWYIAFLKHF